MESSAQDPVAATVSPATTIAMDALKRYPGDVNMAIADDDPMYLGAGTEDLDLAYMGHARVMLDCIRMAMLASHKETAESILDLPSGHGRVLRLLKAEFPEARLAACDIRPDAVDFCAETFGATPVYGKEHPRDVEVDDRFDLIWCGSLFTHLDVPMWEEFLDFFESVLVPGGLVVMTASGRYIASVLRDRETAVRWSPSLGVEGGDDRRERMLQSYDKTGFGFSEYPSSAEQRAAKSEPGSYGLSLVKPSWICQRLESREHLQLTIYTEGRWGAQDVFGCVRVDRIAEGANAVRAPVGGYPR